MTKKRHNKKESRKHLNEFQNSFSATDDCSFVLCSPDEIVRGDDSFIISEEMKNCDDYFSCDASALFDDDENSMTIKNLSIGEIDKESEDLYIRYTRGESTKKLAEEFGKPLKKISRLIAKARYLHIMNLPLEYIASDEFYHLTPEQENFILDDYDVCCKSVKIEKTVSKVNKGNNDFLLLTENNTLLTREKETHLFRKFNYLKYKADQLRNLLDQDAPQNSLMDEIERLNSEAIKIKNELISANLRLVVSVAKKHIGPTRPIYELVSDGNISLIKAVEKFDYTRGFKFSTYASWALYRNFARSIPEDQKYREHYRTSDISLFETCIDNRSISLQKEKVYTEQMTQVDDFMQELDERERAIIQRRYGLGKHQNPQTLRQVGNELGVTKERVRQIEIRAIAKMRKIAHERRMEIPELF